MPQMAPLSWLALFIMFALTLMIFTIMSYPMVSQHNKTLTKSTLMQTSTLNWKW